MNVAVPSVPNAILYMMNPPGGRIRGFTLLKKLNECTLAHNFCRHCGWVKFCTTYHDILIDSDVITNWKGANHVIA